MISYLLLLLTTYLPLLTFTIDRLLITLQSLLTIFNDRLLTVLLYDRLHTSYCYFSSDRLFTRHLLTVCNDRVTRNDRLLTFTYLYY